MPTIAGLIRRSYNGINKHVARRLLPAVLRPSTRGMDLKALGDGDGAWVVPTAMLQPGAICYCIGVGVNATFDVALTGYGAKVYSFDPTPRAIDYMARLDYDRDKLTFLPWGVWNEDTQLKFFAPMNRSHVNHSVVDIHGTGEYFTAECKTLGTVMKALGHDRIDLLKVDIEGSWYTVLEDLVRRKVPVRVLCAEFDSPTSARKAMTMVRLLAMIGLHPVRIDRENFLFVHESELPDAGSSAN